MWLMRRDQTRQLAIRVFLEYRIGAFAELVSIIAKERVLIVSCVTAGADVALGLGESHADLILEIRDVAQKTTLIENIQCAGFQVLEMPL